jgi:hypothetical protein
MAYFCGYDADTVLQPVVDDRCEGEYVSNGITLVKGITVGELGGGLWSWLWRPGCEGGGYLVGPLHGNAKVPLRTMLLLVEVSMFLDISYSGLKNT